MHCMTGHVIEQSYSFYECQGKLLEESFTFTAKIASNLVMIDKHHASWWNFEIPYLYNLICKIRRFVWQSPIEPTWWIVRVVVLESSSLSFVRKATVSCQPYVTRKQSCPVIRIDCLATTVSMRAQQVLTAVCWVMSWLSSSWGTWNMIADSEWQRSPLDQREWLVLRRRNQGILLKSERMGLDMLLVEWHIASCN